MGICCERNLIVKMDNKTKIYIKGGSNLKNKKIYNIELEGDIYKICPTNNSLT